MMTSTVADIPATGRKAKSFAVSRAPHSPMQDLDQERQGMSMSEAYGPPPNAYPMRHWSSMPHSPMDQSFPMEGQDPSAGHPNGAMQYASLEDRFPFLKDDRKRTRKLLTPEQTRILEAILERTIYPSTPLREAVARQLGIPPRKVQIWFQNKRQGRRRIHGTGADEEADASEEQAGSPDTADEMSMEQAPADNEEATGTAGSLLAIRNRCARVQTAADDMRLARLRDTNGRQFAELKISPAFCDGGSAYPVSPLGPFERYGDASPVLAEHRAMDTDLASPTSEFSHAVSTPGEHHMPLTGGGYFGHEEEKYREQAYHEHQRRMQMFQYGKTEEQEHHDGVRHSHAPIRSYAGYPDGHHSSPYGACPNVPHAHPHPHGTYYGERHLDHHAHAEAVHHWHHPYARPETSDPRIAGRMQPPFGHTNTPSMSRTMSHEQRSEPHFEPMRRNWTTNPSLHRRDGGRLSWQWQHGQAPATSPSLRRHQEEYGREPATPLHHRPSAAWSHESAFHRFTRPALPYFDRSSTAPHAYSTMARYAPESVADSNASARNNLPAHQATHLPHNERDAKDRLSSSDGSSSGTDGGQSDGDLSSIQTAADMDESMPGDKEVTPTDASSPRTPPSSTAALPGPVDKEAAQPVPALRDLHRISHLLS